MYFNSRPSARGDEREPADDGAGNYFNSRPSARGDRACRVARTGLVHFNSRPSARGDPDGGVARRNRRVISIHAPPRGATLDLEASLRLPAFQFTPLREGRRHKVNLFSLLHKFQFTPLREGRHEHEQPHARRVPISIHAPPRGATPPPSTRKSSLRNFNSRPSARGDAIR